MPPVQAKQLLPVLDELCGAIEELLLGGLTTVSKSSIERLDVSFKEASRLQLLRLGSTLRVANEEAARFTAGSEQFSARRLAFFLGRAWLLAHSMRRALDDGDAAALDQVMATPPTQPVERLRLVTLGVGKRVVPGSFAAFDFRLRVLDATAVLDSGAPLVWSCVFPMRKDLDLPAEAFLHLPQKQKFRPSLLLEKKAFAVTHCAVSRPPHGVARLVLNEASKVQEAGAFSEWKSLWHWDPRQAAVRLAGYRPTPLDLEIELQEEAFLDSWEAGPAAATGEGYDLLPIQTPCLPFEARLDHGPSGVPLRTVVQKLAQRQRRPPLYGLVHYESCRLVLQPLTALGKGGPEYLTVAPDKISQAELVKAMKFT